MPLRSRKLSRQGIERHTTLERRDSSSGGPAKYEWSINQGRGKEVKLTEAQMREIVIFSRAWMMREEVPVMVCGHANPTAHRMNPTRHEWLLLCEYHADLHDQGHGFEVFPE